MARRFKLGSEVMQSVITARLNSAIRGRLESGILFTAMYISRIKSQVCSLKVSGCWISGGHVSSGCTRHWENLNFIKPEISWQTEFSSGMQRRTRLLLWHIPKGHEEKFQSIAQRKSFSPDTAGIRRCRVGATSIFYSSFILKFSSKRVICPSASITISPPEDVVYSANSI